MLDKSCNIKPHYSRRSSGGQLACKHFNEKAGEAVHHPVRGSIFSAIENPIKWLIVAIISPSCCPEIIRIERGAAVVIPQTMTQVNFA
jgi:hypothetical protein